MRALHVLTAAAGTQDPVWPVLLIMLCGLVMLGTMAALAVHTSRSHRRRPRPARPPALQRMLDEVDERYRRGELSAEDRAVERAKILIRGEP